MLKNLVYLAIFTTFLVAVVIGLNIYHNVTKSTVSSDAAIQIIPITPRFNEDTIKMLQSRTSVQVNLNAQIIQPTGGSTVLPSIGVSKTETLVTPTTPASETQGSPSATPGFFPPGL